MQLNSALLIASLALVQGTTAAPVVVSPSDGAKVAHHLNKRNLTKRSQECMDLSKRNPDSADGTSSSYKFSCGIEVEKEGNAAETVEVDEGSNAAETVEVDEPGSKFPETQKSEFDTGSKEHGQSGPGGTIGVMKRLTKWLHDSGAFPPY